MKIEVRGRCGRRGGSPQRQLAKDLSISQNYVPAIEAGARRAGPELMASLVKYFRCDFLDLFEIYLVTGENGREQALRPERL
jgi:transcriptional regulator with XRE-family HTH domain